MMQLLGLHDFCGDTSVAKPFQLELWLIQGQSKLTCIMLWVSHRYNYWGLTADVHFCNSSSQTPFLKWLIHMLAHTLSLTLYVIITLLLFNNMVIKIFWCKNFRIDSPTESKQSTPQSKVEKQGTNILNRRVIYNYQSLFTNYHDVFKISYILTYNII